MEKSELNYIPEDVTVSILQRLSFICNVRFRCVCKAWNSLLCDRNVMYRSLTDCTDRDDGQVLMNHSSGMSNDFCHISLDGRRAPLSIPNMEDWCPPCLRIVGCCNGLICLTNNRNVILVWNPLTRRTKVLPRSPRCSRFEGTLELCFFEVGFWFDAAANDHKVIKIFHVKWERPWESHIAFLYSFSIRRWRRLHVPLRILAHHINHHMIRTPINSAEKFYHWVGEPDTVPFSKDFPYVVLSFDTVFEVFKMTETPYTVNRYERNLDVGLFMLKDYVAISASSKVGARIFEISVLGKVGVKESWIKLMWIKLMKIGRSVDWLRVLNPWRKGKLFVGTSAGEVKLWDPFTGKVVHVSSNESSYCIQLITYKATQQSIG